MKKISKKISLLLLLGLMMPAGASRTSVAAAVVAKQSVQTAAQSGDIQTPPATTAATPAAPAADPAAPQSQAAAPVNPPNQDFKKQTEEMRKKAFTDGHSKGFSLARKGGKSVSAAHPVAPANPADQAILAKMGPLVTDDLKREAEENRQKAFSDGYEKGFAEGQKAAASAQASKNPKKPTAKG